MQNRNMRSSSVSGYWPLNPDRIEGLVRFQMWRYPGHPAASIPCGWSKEGLPIGLQIIGRRLDDLTVLQVSRAFEKIAPWQDKKPIFN